MPAMEPPITTAVPRPSRATVLDVERSGARSACRLRTRFAPLGDELLVVQPACCKPFARQPVARGVDHGGGPHR